MAAIDEPISVPNSPAIPGLRFRHYRGSGDVPALVEVFNSLADAGQTDFIASVEFFANFFAHSSHFDPYHDVAIVEVGEDVVGFARCWTEDEANGPLVYAFNGQVKPAWQGRGITRALLNWAEAHLRLAAAGHPGGRAKVFQRWVHHGQTGVRALLESEGYAPARYFHLMVRPSLENIPDFPLPEGVEVRPVRPEHYRLIWNTESEAFQDHWGFTPRTEADYQGWLGDSSTFQPDLWQVAWDVATDEVAGQVLTFIDQAENEKFNRRRGYTERISVRRSWRRRGLARALIARSLHAQKARGMTESALGVDSENLSGATRVYEDCGFRTVNINTVYRKAFSTG